MGKVKGKSAVEAARTGITTMPRPALAVTENLFRRMSTRSSVRYVSAMNPFSTRRLNAKHKCGMAAAFRMNGHPSALGIVAYNLLVKTPPLSGGQSGVMWQGLFSFHRIARAFPCVPAALQNGYVRVAVRYHFPCQTGTGVFVRSGAVEDDGLAFGIGRCPFVIGCGVGMDGSLYL
jgi:hypothetical protein